MKKGKKTTPLEGVIDGIYLESVRRGAVLTFVVMAVLSGGLAFVLYLNFLEPYVESNRQERLKVIEKERENKKTETMLAGEAQFREQFKKIVGLYEEATKRLNHSCQRKLRFPTFLVRSRPPRNEITLLLGDCRPSRSPQNRHRHRSYMNGKFPLW
jgi:hypothetical protein